jgi:hypothetical protein
VTQQNGTENISRESHFEETKNVRPVWQSVLEEGVIRLSLPELKNYENVTVDPKVTSSLKDLNNHTVEKSIEDYKSDISENESINTILKGFNQVEAREQESDEAEEQQIKVEMNIQESTEELSDKENNQYSQSSKDFKKITNEVMFSQRANNFENVQNELSQSVKEKENTRRVSENESKSEIKIVVNKTTNIENEGLLSQRVSSSETTIRDVTNNLESKVIEQVEKKFETKSNNDESRNQMSIIVEKNVFEKELHNEIKEVMYHRNSEDRVLNNLKLEETKNNKKENAHASLYRNRPELELYNIKNDKYELNNLANDPKLKVIQDNLFDELKSWMNQQGDLGIPTEMKALTRFKGDTLHWRKGKD